MLKLYIRIMGLLKSERGQDMVEYALITVVISIVVVLAAIFALQPAFETWAEGLAGCITDPAGCSIPFVSG